MEFLYSNHVKLANLPFYSWEEKLISPPNQNWSSLLWERRPNNVFLLRWPALFTRFAWSCLRMVMGPAYSFPLSYMFCAPSTFLSCFLSSILLLHPTDTGAEGQILLCTKVLWCVYCERVKNFKMGKQIMPYLMHLIRLDRRLKDSRVVVSYCKM